MRLLISIIGWKCGIVIRSTVSRAPLITASCTELVRPEKVGLIPEKRQEE